MEYPYVPVGELADLLHPSASRWKALAMLRAYLDESGTHDGSAVVSIGGLIGSKVEWEALEPPWDAVLSEYAERGVKTWHTSDAIHQNEEFAGVDKPGVNHIMTQLSQLLGSRQLAAISSAVVVDDWNAVVRDKAFLERFPTPFALCFEDIVRGLSLWARDNAGGERVAPVFAYRSEYATGNGLGGDVLKMYGAQPWYKNTLAGLGFDWPAQCIPLQAADLIAHQMNWDIQARARGTGAMRTNALEWATGGKYVHGHWFKADQLKLTMQRFAETGEIYEMD